MQSVLIIMLTLAITVCNAAAEMVHKLCLKPQPARC